MRYRYSKRTNLGRTVSRAQQTKFAGKEGG